MTRGGVSTAGRMRPVRVLFHMMPVMRCRPVVMPVVMVVRHWRADVNMRIRNSTGRRNTGAAGRRRADNGRAEVDTHRNISHSA